jgi:hypothetical protein
MGIQAFTISGKTVKIIAATTAPSSVQVPSTTLGGNQYRVINDGAVTAFLSFAMDAATADSNCVIPTGSGSNSKTVLPLLAGTDEILTFPPNAYFTAITSSSAAAIYITPGDGL